jgi:hypothetical protein
MNGFHKNVLFYEAKLGRSPFIIKYALFGNLRTKRIAMLSTSEKKIKEF